MPTEIITHGRVTWSNIIHPTPDDIAQLAGRFPQFHPLNLKDCLTDLEIPKLDHHDNYLFLVVQFPYWDKNERISHPAEIDIFVTNGTLITSHRGELKPLAQMFQLAKDDESQRAEWMGSGASPLLYALLNKLVDYCFPIAQKVHQHIERIETHLFQADTQDMLNDLALVRRDIITLRGILNPQQRVIQALIDGKWPFIHEDLDPYWGDIGDHLNQICSLLDIYAELVAGLSETADTLASHRIDEVMRLLTMITMLTLPLTVISTIFSMNIWLPFRTHPLLFYAVILAGVGLAVGIISYLRRRKWF